MVVSKSIISIKYSHKKFFGVAQLTIRKSEYMYIQSVYIFQLQFIQIHVYICIQTERPIIVKKKN